MSGCRIPACSFAADPATRLCSTHSNTLTFNEAPAERYVMTPEQYDRWHYGFCNGSAPCPLCDVVEIADEPAQWAEHGWRVMNAPPGEGKGVLPAMYRRAHGFDNLPSVTDEP